MTAIYSLCLQLKASNSNASDSHVLTLPKIKSQNNVLQTHAASTHRKRVKQMQGTTSQLYETPGCILLRVNGKR